jgi:hypothetical protein
VMSKMVRAIRMEIPLSVLSHEGRNGSPFPGWP